MRSDDKPVRADDDGPELAAITEQVRPVVDAGKGRALAFEVVRALLMIFDRRSLDRGTLFAEPIASFFEAIDKWLGIALAIEDGCTSDLPSPHLTLLDVAGMADRIASAAWCQARTGQPFPFERAIVLDIATALRRACGCGADSTPFPAAIEVERMQVHLHTRDTLLPLLIRDARRLCAVAKVDVGPIEAAIARHGGRPS